MNHQRAVYMKQFYRDRVLKRLCVACGIKLSRGRKTRRCAACSARRYAWVKERQQELIRGLRCVNCGGTGATRKRKHCLKCLRRAREAREVNRREATKHGLCSRCYTRPAAENSNRCKSCTRGGRDRQRLATTGFSPIDYATFYEVQQGKCAVCREVSKRQLHADHCHRTGTKRGLLCSKCNLGLGQFRDDPELLRAAAAYIELA